MTSTHRTRPPLHHERATPTSSNWGSAVGGRLDREWRRLRHDRRSLATVGGWIGEDALAPAIERAVGARDLQVIVVATAHGAGGQPDRALRRLVEIADADPLAGRIVLQRILPGLVAGAARYHQSFDGADVLDHVLAAAWIAIECFDLDRRRGPVAPSLISDAVATAYRTPMRRRAAHPETPTDATRWREVAESAEPTALEELAEVVRHAGQSGVPDRDLELIRHLAATGSPGRVAVERNVTPRTVRNHRDRAVERIRRAVAIAA